MATPIRLPERVVRASRDDQAPAWALPLFEKLDALQRDVARLAAIQTPRLGRAPHPGDDALLVILATAFGTIAFTATDLAARAAGDDHLRALLEAGRLQTVTAIGRYLSELHKRSPAGSYQLVRVGRDGGGAIWSIEVA